MEQLHNPKVVCTIKGVYTDQSGNETRYEYRVFSAYTLAEVIRLRDCGLKMHPNAKQEIIWED